MCGVNSLFVVIVILGGVWFDMVVFVIGVGF